MESKLVKAGAEEQWQQDFSTSWPSGMFAPACSDHLIVFTPPGTQLLHCKNSHRTREKE